jgi:type IV secretory pathway VirB4 component
MRKVKSNPEKIQEHDVNQNILNIVTPVGLEFTKTDALVGDNYTKYVVVTKFPSNPEFGWLNRITAIEGVTAEISFEPTESGPLIERSNQAIKQQNGDLNAAKDESSKQRKDRAIKDIREMIRRVDEDGEMVGYLNIIMQIQATSKEKLNDRYRRVNSIVTAFGGAIRVLTNYQHIAYKSVAPQGMPKREILDIGERNMPCSTFIGGFVNSSSGINDGTGYLIGKSENGKPIIIDTWLRGGDRTNSNWFVSGIQGMGKSATIKLIAFLEFALGVKLIFLDPEREYIDPVNNLGGRVINCGGGKGGRINPLQIRPVPKLEDEDIEENSLADDYLYNNDSEGTSALALHLQTLRTFHKIYKPKLNDLEMSRLEDLLIRMYEKKGFTWDTDVAKLKPKDFPIYTHLFDEIEKDYVEDKNDPVIKNLYAYFKSIAKGADARIFNGYTDIDFDTEVIDLDISSLLEGDENVLKAQFHNINSWVWSIVSRDRTERILYFLDEGYLIADPDNLDTLKFVRNFAKRCRKYESGIVFITHAVSDLLDPAVKRHGQAIIDGACFKFIMGTDGKNLKETKELFDLTEKETSFLARKQKTKGLFFAGSKRIVAQIVIRENFLKLMGKAGGR